ncbi:MAG: NADH-quinone oxidoreductase subunit NuoE [Rhodospirillales bacterium]|nr:NADH-quinone oxidoreductase subunit NuoE [Rhodospirillales bacterium]
MSQHQHVLEADFQPASFEFTAENRALAERILAKYPANRRRSGMLPLLELAQRQHGGWLPRAAMDHVADVIGVPHIKAYEVATFYTMYNLKPVGAHVVQVCTNVPCWLRGSDGIVDACKKRLGIETGETTQDGKFTMMEVECLGACVNAPMVQVGDEYYEDLTPESMTKLLDDLSAGRKPTPGSQTGRRTSMSSAGATTLKSQALKAGVTYIGDE